MYFLLYNRLLFMYSLSSQSVQRLDTLTQEVCKQSDYTPEQLRAGAAQLLQHETYAERTHALLEASFRCSDRKAQPHERQLARYALFHAALTYNGQPAETSACIGFMYIHLEAEKSPVATEEHFAFIDIVEDFSKAVTDPAETVIVSQPNKKVSNTFAHYLELAELLYAAGPDALLRLKHIFNITHPTRYPIQMLLNQLERYALRKDNPFYNAPEALVMVGGHDPEGSLTHDPFYSSIDAACMAVCESLVFPTIVECNESANELVELLAQPRNIQVGFINAHGSWDNIDIISKRALKAAVTRNKAGAAIQQNWRSSGGIALLSCHSGAVSAETGELGIDAALANIIQKPVIASDDFTYNINVRRSTMPTNAWTVEFHVPAGRDLAATIAKPVGYVPQPGAPILHRKTVFRNDWLPEEAEIK